MSLSQALLLICMKASQKIPGKFQNNLILFYITMNKNNKIKVHRLRKVTSLFNLSFCDVLILYMITEISRFDISALNYIKYCCKYAKWFLIDVVQNVIVVQQSFLPDVSFYNTSLFLRLPSGSNKS